MRKPCLKIDTAGANRDWFLSVLRHGGMRHGKEVVAFFCERQISEDYDLSYLVSCIMSEGEFTVFETKSRCIVMASLGNFRMVASSSALEVAITTVK